MRTALQAFAAGSMAGCVVGCYRSLWVGGALVAVQYQIAAAIWALVVAMLLSRREEDR